jgi:predicted HTH domain antitoxin
MNQAVIPYPSGYAQILKLSDREFARELSFLAAAKLYELGRFTAGQASRLAQMDRLAFLARLQDVGVPAINLRDEEVDAEIEAARELAG